VPKRSQRRFTQEFKDEAVRMVLEGDRTVVEVAREFGIHDTTLGNWVRLYKHQHEGEQAHSLSGPDRARLRELERENKELREKVQFLKKAAAFFAGETR
jgi:transposase